MRKFLLLAAAALSLTATSANAWGPTGHRVTAKIAQTYLTPQAQAGISEILGVETLAEASNWPDFMRSADDSFWQKGSPPYHYITVPPGTTYSTGMAPPEGDAVTALAQFTQQIRDESLPMADRQLALRFAAHIIQDLHQPLHNGKGDDRGGNSVRVLFMDEPQNLHWVWDEGLIDNQKLSYTEKAHWLQRRITTAQQVEWTETNPQVWIEESIVMRDKIYAGLGPMAPNTIPNLRYDYIYQHTGDIDLRLQQGGIRLAAYMNELFAE
ncbi:endonuclease [Litorimonas cladophorae]|uniref:Endonuclease n=1 Tax=Litorimonas cladophorae TaxID=1220491 RepID=A0A918KFE2_9PROT|nr:S1/P1 nuclease [Litorimonas cladophorae]GGX61544.1 endonuclease [Litorimonas cladophorae]